MHILPITFRISITQKHTKQIFVQKAWCKYRLCSEQTQAGLWGTGTQKS